MRIDKGGVQQSHLFGISGHQAHKDCNIGLSILVGNIETTEIPIGPFLQDKTTKVAGNSHGYVIGRCDQQCKQGLFQSHQSFFLWVEIEPSPAYAAISRSRQEFESRYGDEIFLDDLVSSVEGEQLAYTCYGVWAAIFVPFDKGSCLQAENGPFFCSDVGKCDIPQHSIPIGTLSRRQFHVDRMRKDGSWIQRTIILQCGQSLRTQCAIPDEDLRVIMQRPKVEDGLVEESSIVSEMGLALRKWLRGDCVELFHGEGGKDATGFLRRGREGFQSMRFIVARHTDYLYNTSIPCFKLTIHHGEDKITQNHSFFSLSFLFGFLKVYCNLHDLIFNLLLKNIIYHHSSYPSHHMQGTSSLSPNKKTNKFVLKIKNNAGTSRSPDRTVILPSNLHPPQQGIDRCLSSSTYRAKPSSRFPSRYRQSKEAGGGFQVCASRTVCVFARRTPPLTNHSSQNRPFPSFPQNFLNDQLLLQGTNSPQRRRYRLHPKSSAGFRRSQNQKHNRGTLTEEKSRVCFEPWQVGFEGAEIDDIWVIDGGK